MEMLFLDPYHVNILTVIVYYGFARCNHWGEPSKVYNGITLYYFFQLQVNLQLFQDFKILKNVYQPGK